MVNSIEKNKGNSNDKVYSNLDSNKTTINFFNNKSDSYSTNLNKVLVGGINQE